MTYELFGELAIATAGSLAGLSAEIDIVLIMLANDQYSQLPTTTLRQTDLDF